MPNWCSNNVVFSSKDEGKLQPLDSLFELLRKRELETQHGQVPDFVTEPDGYLFEVQWESPALNFESKWAPPIQVIKQIADKFKLDFVYEYSEPGNGVYGRYTYTNKVLVDICLDSTDLDQYEYNEETERYQFEGEEWDSDDEIKETLLDRKIIQYGNTRAKT